MHSSKDPKESHRAERAAMFVAGATIAHLVAGKAIQNPLFLSTTSSNLALAQISQASGLFSIVFFFVAYWAMVRQGPARLVPWIYGASGSLLVVEWLVMLRDPTLGSILVYLHLNGFSLVLISGFWALVSERFDPRTAKRNIGRIGGAATLGGLLGGLVALGFSAQALLGGIPLAGVVPLLAVVHGLCSWQVRHVTDRPSEAGSSSPGSTGPAAPTELASGLRRVLTTSYLRNLALLVLLVAVTEGLVDYVFKTRAKMHFLGDSGGLAVFFALYYTSVAALAFVIQWLFSRKALERFGLVRTVASLPLVMTLGGLGAMLIPNLASVAGARGVGTIVRDSLYRSGYELLYLPVSSADRRATKLILDVGLVRLGDVVWGGVVWSLAAGFGAAGVVGPALVSQTALVLAALLGGITCLVVTSFHRGYVRVLEESLLARGGALGDALTIHSTLLQTFGGIDLTLAPSSGAKTSGEPAAAPPSSAKVPQNRTGAADPLRERIADLRSNEAERVRLALQSAPIEVALVSHVVPLLAWDEVAMEAIEALRGVAPEVTGQLVDLLLDPQTEDAVRRRLPRVLTAGEPGTAVEGLFAALADSRFEVRYRSGQALARLQGRHSSLLYPRERIVEAVLREVAVDRRIWEQHRLLDRLPDPPGGDTDSPGVDQYLRERAKKGLEHVFRLLSLFLPRGPLTIAFRGLHTDDAHLRGTALEYLETSLPEAIRVKLWPFLEDNRESEISGRSREEILNSLLESNNTIAEWFRKRMRADQPGKD